MFLAASSSVQPPQSPPLFLLILGLLVFPAAPTAAISLSALPRTLSHGGNEEQLRNLYHIGTPLGLQVAMARFGNQIEDAETFDLMFPPEDDDGHLCSVPPSVNATAEGTELSQYTYPIGLFVKDEKCSHETKALNLIEMMIVVPRLNYLVVYGTDPQIETTLVYMDADSSENLKKLELIGALYVPTKPANELREQMEAQAADENKSPYFLDPDNQEFSFRVLVKNLYFQDGEDDTIQPEEDVDYDHNFYWFRFVLFAMLIVAPCFRAAWLWYQGGGRFIWRRDENGRIIGIQYIPPIPYWLAAGRFLPHNHEPNTSALTEEQFASLPEIKYEPADPFNATEGEDEDAAAAAASEDDNKNHNDELEMVVLSPETAEDKTPADGAAATAADTSVALSEKDLELQLSSSSLQQVTDTGMVEDDDGDTNASADDNARMEVGDTAPAVLVLGGEGNETPFECPGAPEESPITPPLPETASPQTTDTEEENDDRNTTTCTACSICIDDFVAGESLVLLPRCRHAFHRDCIHPWLRERQGCCPLCKTDVLPPRETETDHSAPSLVEEQDGEPARGDDDAAAVQASTGEPAREENGTAVAVDVEQEDTTGTGRDR